MGHKLPVIIRSRISAETDKKLTKFISAHPTLTSMSATIRYALEQLVSQEKRRRKGN